MFPAAVLVAAAVLSTSSCSDEPAPAATETLVPIVEPTPATPAPSSALVGIAETPKGKVAVDGRRRVVYVYDKDKPVKDGKGSSACVDTCTKTWQPLTTETGMAVALPGISPKALGVFARADGTTQVTLDGKPLYLYTGDKKPLETKGDGIEGVWHVVVPK